MPDLFTDETYTTLQQMTSLIEGQLQPDKYILALLAALFPFGSITGAPKLWAMAILRDVEFWPRDIYCGKIGWMAPDGRLQVNVEIPSLLFEEGQITLNASGGVVWDSTAPDE